MNEKWPSFVTKDLGPDDDDEMLRRWQVYDREMKILISTGKFHQDEDGWWVETATGELVGPDPEIEFPDIGPGKFMVGIEIPEEIRKLFPKTSESDPHPSDLGKGPKLPQSKKPG